MKNKLQNNFLFKILAIFLAVLLWLYVTNQQNPISEATFSVPLDVTNLPQKLVVAEKLPSVTVRLMARKHLLEKTSTRDIKAFLNLQNAKNGVNQVDVNVSVPKDIQVVSVTPVRGEVTLTTVTSKQIALNLKITNPPPEGYVILTKQLTPTQVIVSGPQNILDKVTQVAVEANLAEQKSNLVQRLPVRIYDEQGNELSDWLKATPEVVESFTAIAPVQPRKQLAIKPVFTGALTTGKAISRIIIEPEQVTVTGSETALNRYYVVDTKPIDLTGKQQTFSTEAPLNLPEGVTAYPTSTVRITVELGP